MRKKLHGHRHRRRGIGIILLFLLALAVFCYNELRLLRYHTTAEQSKSVMDSSPPVSDLAKIISAEELLAQSRRRRQQSSHNNNLNQKQEVSDQVPHWKKWAGSKFHRQIQARASLRLPLPILVVGLPKAGTSSLFHFFRCNSLSSQHFYCCKEQNSTLYQSGAGYVSTCMLNNLEDASGSRSILQGCGDSLYQAFTELNGPRPYDENISSNNPIGPRIFLPQQFELERLYKQFPRATWILNQRGVGSWVDSVLRWGGEGEDTNGSSLKSQLVNEYHVQYGTDLEPKNEHAFLEWLYRNHTDTVKRFVQDHSTISLVELDIEDSNAGRALGEALGLEAFCWNKYNRNDKTI